MAKRSEEEVSKKPALWHLCVLGLYTVMVLWYLAWTGIAGAKDWCILVPGVSEANCASWVQAFGSIVAIAAGVATVWWQLFRQRIAVKKEEARRLFVIRSAAFQAAVDLSYFRLGLERKEFDKHSLARVAVYAKSISAMPLLEVPDAHVAHAIGMAAAETAIFESNTTSPTPEGAAGSWDHRRAHFFDQEARYLLAVMRKVEYMAGCTLKRRGEKVERSRATHDGQLIYEAADVESDLETLVRNVHI